MKRIFMPLFVMAIVLSAAVVMANDAPVNTEKSKIESVAVTPAPVQIVHQEAYKIDDGEYKGAVASKSYFPSEGSFLVGFGIFAFVLLILRLCKLYTWDFFRSLMSPKVQLGIRAGMLVIAAVTANGLLAAMALLTPFAIQWSGVLGDTAEETALLEKVKTTISENVDKHLKSKGLSKEQIDSVITEKMKAYEDMDPKKLKQMVEDFEALKTEHGKIKNEMRKSGSGAQATLKSMMAEQFAEKEVWENAKQVAKQGAGKVEIFTTNKAVGTVTTDNVTTDTGGNAILDLLNADDLRSLNLRDPFIEQFATVTRSSKPVYTYADYLPKEGSVNFVGQGDTKPQIDIKVEVKHQTPRKAAGYMVHSTEVIQDVPRMESESRTLLLKKYLLRRQNGILYGDGLGDNPLGVTEIAAAYDADVAGVQNADANNLRDAIVGAATQIYNTVNYVDEVQYMPNVAFVNPIDHSNLKLIKTEFGMYLFPDIPVTSNNSNIGGFPVVAKSEIPAGKLLIGDFSYLNIVNYIDYAVSVGWVNDQFIKNLFTMIGEGRFFTYVRTLDQKAFIYDDIDTILAGIVSGPSSGS